MPDVEKARDQEQVDTKPPPIEQPIEFKQGRIYYYQGADRPNVLVTYDGLVREGAKTLHRVFQTVAGRRKILLIDVADLTEEFRLSKPKP